MKQKAKIGVITGGGAIAGAKFYMNLMKYFAQNGASRDADFPNIIFYNYPFESLTEKGISDYGLYKKEISYALDSMRDCSEIYIFCNTLHYNLEIFLENEIMKKIKSLPEIIRESYFKKESILLCSETSKRDDIFRLNEKVKYAEENLQVLVNKIIENQIIADEKSTNLILKKVLDYCVNKNIKEITLGCTELYFLNWGLFELNGIQVNNPKDFIFKKIEDKFKQKKEFIDEGV